MINPYAAPKSFERDDSSNRMGRLALFAVNFLLALSLAVLGVAAALHPSSPIDAPSGIAFCVPFLGYSIFECLVFFRREAFWDRKLAHVNFGAAGLVVAVILAQLWLVRRAISPTQISIFQAAIMLWSILMAYLFFCGWCRNRWTCKSRIVQAVSTDERHA